MKNLPNPSATVSALVPWILLGTLSVLFCFEWKTRRQETERIESTLRGYQRGSEGRFEEAKDRMLSLINPLRQSLNGLESELSKIATTLACLLPANISVSEITQPKSERAEHLPSYDPFAEFTDESLPELPAGVQPTGLVKNLDLKTFFEDKRFNPSGKELAPVERLKAIEAMRTGQAYMEMLDGRIQVDLAAGMEVKRAKADYIEYADGDARDAPIPGTLTAAEPAGDHRIRMFYFDLAEFPEIAEKKAQIEKVAEHTVRRLLKLAAD